MAWNDLNSYFETLPTGILKESFQKASTPWAPLAELKATITKAVSQMPAQGSIGAKKINTTLPDGSEETSYFIEETTTLNTDFVDLEASIFIGKNTFLEAGATIKSCCYIEGGCEVRQGAYLRGNIYLGAGTVAGHTTEIKNSILLTHVEAGHFAYIGDSIIGSYVNLGAGTKISNLQFRTLAQKTSQAFTATEIKLKVDEKEIPTGLVKLGAIVGDGVEIGCNAVLSPGCLIMKEAWVVPNLSVPKGVYEAQSILKNLQNCKDFRL